MLPQQELLEPYRCPGEKAGISRAVHLGRMARFYPDCCRCRHREDTGPLSPRQVKRLQATWQRAEAKLPFEGELAAGEYLQASTPAAARETGAAFAVWLHGQDGGSAEAPVVVVGADGRPLTPESLAAATEGLRWAGCHVVDVGPVTAACLAFAVHHLQADGGVLVAGPGRRERAAGLKFWCRLARPLSPGGPWDDIRRMGRIGVDRPTRRYGSLRRFDAGGRYLASFGDSYHALRPLRIGLDAACPPLVGYLGQLASRVACRILPCPTAPRPLTETFRREKAHFALRVDGDGECCQAVDESGREVPPEQLFLLVAREVLRAGEGAGKGGAVVLEEGWLEHTAEAVRTLGGRPVWSPPLRAEVDRQMREHRAILGGGSGGRIWYYEPGAYSAADALRTVTLLLQILSRSDRPFSQILDVAQTAR